MSRRVAVGLVLAALAGAAPAARGQSDADLQARMRRLEAMHASAVEQRIRAENQRRATLDTLREGPLLLLAHRNVTGVVREAMVAIVPKIVGTYGDAAVALGVATPATPPVVLWDSVHSAFSAEFEIARQVQQRLAPPPGHVWRRWAMSGTFGPFSPEQLAAGLTRTYVDLVTTASTPTTDCFTGSIQRCAVALQLEPSTDPAVQWYTDVQRRELVRRAVEDTPYRTASSSMQSCLRGSDEACIAVIRSGDVAPLPPLGGFHRTTLTSLVLARGGAGTWLRLIAPARDIPEALSHAAREPVDSVVAAWRSAVIAARPVRVTTRPRTGWAAVFWTVVFAALAMGGTQWRRA